MDSDELAAFIVVLINVRFDKAVWMGSGKALAAILHWEPRKAQRVLKSLSSKGYIYMHHTPGIVGNYPIEVPKFSASNGPYHERQKEHSEGQNERHLEHTLKEVGLKEEKIRSTPTPTPTASLSFSERQRLKAQLQTLLKGMARMPIKTKNYRLEAQRQLREAKANGIIQ